MANTPTNNKDVDLGAISPSELEEHGHVGGLEQYHAYKAIIGAPTAYKGFPSLASGSGYIYHAVGPVGAASGASVWRVFREERGAGTILWAGGSADWSNALIDVTALSYS